MSDIKLYEFKLLHLRCTLWKVLHVFFVILLLVILARIIFALSSTSNYRSIAELIFFFFLYASCDAASTKSSYYKKEIKKVKIMDSMTDEWTEVKFSLTNSLDAFIRRDNVSEIFVRKQDAQYVEILYKPKTGKKPIKHSVSIYTAMDTLDLSIFLD